MKAKFGFVSNSSSTSFCVYGAMFYLDELQEFVTNLKYQSMNPDQKKVFQKILNEKSSSIKELCETVINTLNINHLSKYIDGECGQYCFIGVNPEHMDDDVIPRIFKDRIKKEFQRGNPSIEVKWRVGEIAS